MPYLNFLLIVDFFFLQSFYFSQPCFFQQRVWSKRNVLKVCCFLPSFSPVVVKEHITFKKQHTVMYLSCHCTNISCLVKDFVFKLTR